MSGTVSGLGFAALGQLTAGLVQVRKNYDTLTQQASSGFISNTYAGLNGGGSISLALSPQIDNLRIVQSNISAASGPAGITQTAMAQIGAIASNLVSQIPNLTSFNSGGVDVIAANARAALAQVGELLNSQYGGVYVFAGADSSNPPVPDPDNITSSGFFTQISAVVSSLSTNGSAATVATTLAVAGSNAVGSSPFSSFMSQPTNGLSPPSVSTGDGQSRTIGLLASGNTSAVSTGTSTTGSYMRDLMRALATIGSLTSAQASDPNFAGLIADTQTSVIGAVAAMSSDVGILAEQQSSLTTLSTTLDDTATVLTGQLSSVQEVDMAVTLSNLSLTQTQLQESYQLISAANGMSLAKFL